MKKIIVIVSLIIFSLIIFFLGKRYYDNYQIEKFEKSYELKSYKLDKLIKDQAKNNIKTNDLIFVCELRKGLWDTDVSVDEIVKESELNSSKFRNYLSNIKSAINNDKEIKEFVEDDFNGAIIGSLCTRINPDNGFDRSIYGDLLNKKYNLSGSYKSLGDIDINLVTEDDLKEYQNAKIIEDRFRKNF